MCNVTWGFKKQKKEIIIWGHKPPYNFMYINYTAYAAEESATVMRTSRKYN